MSKILFENKMHELGLKIKNEAKSMSVFCKDHPIKSMRPKLKSMGISTYEDLLQLISGRTVRVTGMLVIVHMPPTRSKKRVIFVTIEDETGLIDLAIFRNAQLHFAREILTSEILTVQGRLQRRGRGGLAISIVVDKVITELSGPLMKLLP
jgi:error-prone DNA polymerase